MSYLRKQLTPRRTVVNSAGGQALAVDRWVRLRRSLLRLSHPGRAVGSGNPVLDVSAEHARLFEWIVRGTLADGLPAVVDGFVAAQQAATAADAARLVREHGLPREALQPEHLRSPEV